MLCRNPRKAIVGLHLESSNNSNFEFTLRIKDLSVVPEAGIEPARLAAGDFESPASTNFTTRALGDRARGALERRRALYGVIKVVRARLRLGILKHCTSVCSSRGSPRPLR